MNRALVGTILTLAACRNTPPAGPKTPDAAGDRTAVERVLVDWYTAIRTKDSAGVAAALAPEFFIYEDTTAIGRDALIAGVVSGFAAGTQTAEMSGFATQVRGDVAWTSFRNLEVWTPTTPAAPDTLRFLETVVFERHDGRWLMERYHATRINRPAR